MIPNPNTIFPMVDNPPEQTTLDQTEYVDYDNDNEMFDNGVFTTYSCGGFVHFVNPQKTIFNTFILKLPTVNMKKNLITNKIQTVDATIPGYIVAFLKTWLYNKDPKEKITASVKMRDMSLYKGNAILILSVPDFLLEKFHTETKKANISVQQITPESVVLHCNYCGNNVQSINGDDICPTCGRILF